MLKSLPLCVSAAALALAACSQPGSDNGAAPAQTGEAKEAAGEKTIAASLDQNGKFFQAAKAVGLDATLAGPGPYTVLVASDAAFTAAGGDALKNPADPKNRAEITRILTYHILPGVILADDISKAIDNSKGKAVLATMGGGTVTATKEDGKTVLTDSAGNKATVTNADEQFSNGVVHRISAVLLPSREAGAPPAVGDKAGNSAG